MSEKKQFDSLLGGQEKLPRDAEIINLATARVQEMAELTKALENPQQTKLIFQKLPVHMRRRVMSHNAKRLPRKLRNSHISQMKKSGLPPKSKKPSRKYRRRPHILLQEYNRRQRDKIWLETHIWHAKRFKMIEKWGFKLPNHSNDRCFKANYRAVINHCLIQDISYYSCLELQGPLDVLKNKLNSHCNPNELFAKNYINGNREGTLMFYKKNSYPHNPIGHVQFLWLFSDCEERAIWISIHPAIYESVFEEILSTFNLELEKNNLDTESEASQEKSRSQDLKKENFESRIPTYSNNEKCKLLVLRNCLNRFRLCGPLSLSILSDTLKVPKVNFKANTINGEKMIIDTEEESLSGNSVSYRNISWQIDVDKSENSIDAWFKTYYQVEKNLIELKDQSSVFDNFKSLSSPNQLPPNMVLPLTVLDPRFFLPHKRTKSLPDPELLKSIFVPPTSVSKSPLWISDIRNYVTKKFMPTAAINDIRSQNLVPGVGNDEHYNEDIMHKIPILLIQKPGDYAQNSTNKFGSGIDIILPTNWSMPFWLAFILRCARAGGLRESKSIAFENSNLNIAAVHHPDTDAYKEEANFQRKELTEKYFKLPPNKRTNYIKFAITSPFYCEWKLLMKEWVGVEDFYVLRDRQILSILSSKFSTDFSKKEELPHNEIDKLNNITFDRLIENKNCYVPVEVTIEGKGIPKDFSIICVPNEEDLLKFQESEKWGGPIETFKADPNEEKRKNLKQSHQAHLKRLKRNRTRAKKKMNNAVCDSSIENTSDIKHLNKIRQLVKKKLDNVNKSLIEKQSQTMENLYLPQCTAVRNSCDREVIGYVVTGDFSFSKAKGIGLGYIVFSALDNLIKNKSNIVLVRNTTTRQYRKCKLKILN